MVTVLLGSQEWLNQVRELCGDSIATVNSPEAAAKTLAALHRYSQGF